MQTRAAHVPFAARPMRSRGFLIVLSGPSGAGKNSLLNQVLPRVPDLIYSVSVTTRPSRPGEVDGVHYHFVDNDGFDEMIHNDQLLEWAEFAGNRYGTPRRYVEEQIAAGQTIITDIDIQGARSIKATMGDAVFVFLLPPSFEELKRRLQGRGTETDEVVRRRLQLAEAEVEAIVDYDYWVMNDDLDDAAQRLTAIIEAERAKVHRLDLQAITDAGDTSN